MKRLTHEEVSTESDIPCLINISCHYYVMKETRILKIYSSLEKESMQIINALPLSTKTSIVSLGLGLPGCQRKQVLIPATWKHYVAEDVTHWGSWGGAIILRRLGHKCSHTCPNRWGDIVTMEADWSDVAHERGRPPGDGGSRVLDSPEPLGGVQCEPAHTDLAQ